MSQKKSLKNTSRILQMISVDRGSALSRRSLRDQSEKTPKNNAEKTPQSHMAQEFLTYNKKGETRVFVAGGSRSGNDPIYEQEAFLLGQEIGRRNFRLDFGLSSKGIMGSVAKGVLKSWGEQGRQQKTPIHGVTTKEYLALYQSDQLIDEVSEIIVAHTLEERKQQLLGADFVIFAPGGVGTLDELVYDCVAMQDGFLNFKPFVLFNVEGFFHHLLEFLKEIQQKKFSDPVPFIVVDNSFEAGIAFDMLSYYTPRKMKPKDALEIVQQLIYLLPYVIRKKMKNSSETVHSILETFEQILEGDNETEKNHLIASVETAYLNKEIDRMYDRLAKAGRDTAIVSDKLTDLKKRSQFSME